MDPNTKDYLAIVQCDIVMERCSGFFCEQALTNRTGGLAVYAADRPLRHLMLTCGGCCGRALQRKLANLVSQLEKREGVTRERIAVQFATCITKDSHHGPPCPHLDYLKTLIERLDLEWAEDTHLSDKSQRLRETGVYEA
jgi:predicted metal-binding protein